jgi:hypothetical protein
MEIMKEFDEKVDEIISDFMGGNGWDIKKIRAWLPSAVKRECERYARAEVIKVLERTRERVKNCIEQGGDPNVLLIGIIANYEKEQL